MTDKKINQLSNQLCELLGANASDANVQKVSAVLGDLVSEIAVDHSKCCNEIVREHAGQNSVLARQITEDIKSKRETLVANLSAMR